MVQAGLAYNPVSKRERIRQAVAGNQQRTGNGNALVAFIREAMNPQRYMRRPELFEERRQRLDEVLVFVGLHVSSRTRSVRSPLSLGAGRWSEG
jgi:hypothetical protein